MKYIPHIYQQAFHQSNARYRFLCAGRRGGKTVAGAVEMVIRAMSTPNGQGAVLSPTFPMLRDVAVPEILKWGSEYISSFNRSEMVMYFKNGYKLLLRSASDPDKLRGLKLHHLWMDEATSFTQLAWDTISPALVDFRGIVWVTTTPKGKDWIYQNFWVPFAEGDKDYAAWRYKTVENTYIDKDLVDKEEKRMEGKFFRQEYEASFEEFMGQIFPDFSLQKHVIDSFPIPSDWRIIKGMDIGYTHPFGALWAAIDEEDRYFVFREYRKTSLTVKENGENIKALDKEKGEFYIDPSAYATDHVTGTAKTLDLELLGLRLVPANNDVMAGINRITDLIKSGRLFIFRECSLLIDEIVNYHWDEKSTLRNNPKPYKLNDDLVDPLRYLTAEYFDVRRPVIKAPKELTELDIKKYYWDVAMGNIDNQSSEPIEDW